MSTAVPESPRSNNAAVTAERLVSFLNLENSVRTWIEATLNIPLRGDFMEAIKNGVVLCYLMKELDEFSIPRVQDTLPLAPMLAQENISFFLAAAADYGVSPHKRFFPFDLWNGNSRPRVVESLAELARVAAAKKFRIAIKVTDLPIDKLPNPLTPEATKLLTEQLAKTRTRETGAARKDAPGIFKRKLALLVSQKEYPDFERRWTRIQALMRGRAARNKFQSRVMNQAFRDKIAHELQDTETTYLAGLKLCIDRYLSPLKSGSWNKKLVLPPQTLKRLFSDIEIIHNVNAVLKQNIDKAMESWGPASQLGSVFVVIMNFLKVYANYVSTADAQLSEYDSLLKNNKLFAQFVEEIRVANPGTLDIPGYLIMPIQRVPRYFMLLERLTKHTWKDHRDYADLEKSVSGLQAVASHLNEQKRKFENIRSVIAFQSAIVGCPQITMPSRCFVQQYEVEDVKKKEWFLVLFNDSVLLAKTEKKKGATVHKFKDHLLFPDVEVSSEKEQTLDLLAKGGTIIKLAVSPTSNAFTTQLPITKATFKSVRESRLGPEDTDAHANQIAFDLVLDAPPETRITAEELLKQREIEKKQLKAQMAEEMKLLKTPGENPETRTSSPSRRPTTAIPMLRNTQSLLKMKAIVEQQITVLETYREEGEGEPKNVDEIRRMASNLSDELAELDEALENVKGGLTAEAREALNQEESAVRLKVAEEPKTMSSKKKPRKSFFSFFTSSSSGNHSSENSPSKDKTPPSSSKLSPSTSKLKNSGKHGSKVEVSSPSSSPSPSPAPGSARF